MPQPPSTSATVSQGSASATIRPNTMSNPNQPDERGPPRLAVSEADERVSSPRENDATKEVGPGEKQDAKAPVHRNEQASTASASAARESQRQQYELGVGGVQRNKLLETPNTCGKNQPWRKWVPKEGAKDEKKPWIGYQPDPKNESAKPWVDWVESMGPTASFLEGAMSGNAGG